MTGATAVLHRPGTVGEAVRMLAEVGDVELLAGGTDLVPALRAGLRRPRALVALRRVLELRARGVAPDRLTIGAGVTYAELADWEPAPGLAAAARAVGSAQIRNTGTVGGALGSANPRGDLLTFLTAVDAEVLTRSARAGSRAVPLVGFLATGRRRGELVTAVRVPVTRGPQVFLKIGGRQAAYPALLNCALVVDGAAGRIRCAIGGVTTGRLRPGDAEDFAAGEIDWSAPLPSGAGVAQRFGELVALAAQEAPEQLPAGPRDPADYRWHAAGVLASRALARALAAASGDSDSGARGGADGDGTRGTGTA
ncbi:FAD binding domain-containing protein [Pseudofrankia inefficax]|uniref:Molybdopterin dehydrogenase FAD-binding protein n=1 Tax=Pseudofrankia inefficax (strain DSM 45817 / CECT 9037 / DDB 130130 / EuI1c) TaxID=298654 RepID=E3IYC9_PSEI1|nr:FAD binding domain-containing protein [Pseudofrankia inefficax]ADP83874.1 molybdopterin dehydrogenase FAD-binding protein [Pseudofrankia inefficax]